MVVVQYICTYVSDAGGGQFPARLPAGLQCPGSSAAHTSCVAAAVSQPGLCPLYAAQRTCWGTDKSAISLICLTWGTQSVTTINKLFKVGIDAIMIE